MPFLSGKCWSKARLDGKTAIVTGCNTGIGKTTAKDFIKRSCRVIMACRDVSKAEAAAQEIRKETEGVQGVGEIVVVRLDLASFASVRQCAQQLLRTETHIHLLINNAGVALCPRSLTEDGFETHFAVNHLGPFLFTLLLLPLILKSTPARIVNVSSMIHEYGRIDFDDINLEKSYNPTWAYARSKLAVTLFSNDLANRLQGTGVTTYCPHPGAVHTEGQRHFDTAYFKGCHWLMTHVFIYAFKKPKEGAQTTIYCAVEEKIGDESGFYYGDCKKSSTSKAPNPDLALRLWEESIKMTGLQEYDPFTAEVPTKPIGENLAQTETTKNPTK